MYLIVTYILCNVTTLLLFSERRTSESIIYTKSASHLRQQMYTHRLGYVSRRTVM